MSALLSLLVPGWLKALGATLVALGGVGLFAWLRGKSVAAQIAHEKDQVAAAIVTNHAVERQESAAITDKDADAALDAAAHPDHS